MRGTPQDTDAGTYASIEIRVSDGTDSAALAPFAIEVLNAPNRAPTITGSPPVSVTAEQNYVFAPQASDADGDTLTFSISGKPSWAGFDTRTGELHGTPQDGDAGVYAAIEIRVSDGTDSAALKPFSIEVQGLPNNAPVVSGSPQTEVVAGQSYGFQPQASDPDGDALSFSITRKPAWASFNSKTGQLSGTPSAQDVGTYYDIVITVTDGKADASLPAFSVDVTQNANGAVTLSWTPPTTNTDGSPLQGLNGYVIAYGQVSGQYTESVTITNPGITSAVIEELVPATWHFAVKATTDSGTESDYSDEAVKTIM